ncbi:MAG: DUF4388 domain-containing protein [Burkholderiales bacterium]|nr:DUF4388 domain-containing protein [Burkholderiales bacterium]
MEIAVVPDKTARWLELSLAGVEGLLLSRFETRRREDAGHLELLVMDGEQPGPDFLALYRAYAARYGECHKLVLGETDAPVIRMIDWSPEMTSFLPKPFQLETVRAAVEQVARRLTGAGPPHRQSLGYLSTLRLADLLQMLCLNGWSGRIDVEQLATGRKGSVFLNGGALIHASTDSDHGEGACHEMLGWERCEFQFSERHSPVVPSIRAPWQQVVLEAARRIDEQRQKIA